MRSKEDKATVALLGGSLRVGGAERQIARLLRGLVDSPFRPVLILKNREGPLLDEIADLDVQILGLGFRRLHSPKALRALRRLRRFLEEENVRILQSYVYGGHLIAALALDSITPWRNVPRPHHVICVRSHHLPRSSFFKPFYRWAARRAAAAAAVSDDIASTMRGWGIPEEKAVVIPNGVPLIEPVSEEQCLEIRAEVGAPEGSVLMGMVGNFREGKGHEDLIRALTLLSGNEHPGWHLVLVGDGRMYSPMRKLARDLGLGERIHFTGRRDDVSAILPALDLFVYPSHSEGMPNALLEAMAAGVPCIASDIPVHRDLLDGGAAGRLVPPGNPEELSRALVDLLEGDDMERLGRLGRKRIQESFSEQVMVQNYMELYGRLLGAR